MGPTASDSNDLIYIRVVVYLSVSGADPGFGQGGGPSF